MNRVIAFVFGLAIVAAGCESTHFANEIKTIDSLLVELDTLEMAQRRIDTTDFFNASQRFTENLNFVQKTYTNRNDTMPRDVAMLMSDYRALKKPSKGFQGKFQRTSEELEFAKTQLADLKHDLQNNLLDSVLVDEMLYDELEAVEKVKRSVEDLKLSSEFTKGKRAELEPRIDSLIQALKQDES